jgi:uncharacterized protein YkwD
MNKYRRFVSKSLLSAGVVVLASAALATPASAKETPSEEALRLVNESRASAGVCPVEIDKDIQKDAKSWSSSMARSAKLSHSVLDVAGASIAAENVGRATDVASAHNLFLLSPGHRANILNPRFDSAGFGSKSSGGSVWVTYQFEGSAAVEGC